MVPGRTGGNFRKGSGSNPKAEAEEPYLVLVSTYVFPECSSLKLLFHSLVLV